MQTIGTHNSYHVTPDDALRKLLTRSSVRALLGSEAAAQIPSSWEATQAPLGTQLTQYGECDAILQMAGTLGRALPWQTATCGAIFVRSQQAEIRSPSMQNPRPDRRGQCQALCPIRGHIPAGIRQLELDAYPDPQGDLFGTSAGRKLAGENGFLPIPALRRPGWKVVHLAVCCRLVLSIAVRTRLTLLSR